MVDQGLKGSSGSQVGAFPIQSSGDLSNREYDSLVIQEVTGEGIQPIPPFQIDM